MARLIVQGGLGAGPGGVPCDLDAANGELFVIADGQLPWTGRLLRTIAGLVDSRLEISVGGKRVGDLPPDQRGVGFVFPGGALFPHLSVTDNVCFPLVSRNAPRYVIEERLAAVVAITGIEALLGRRPAALTALEKLRVAVARSLMREPGVLLLEDPLSTVSGSSRRTMREELLQLHQRSGITFVVTCSESWDAFALADRMALCVGGRVRQIGIPTELYEKPADKFVAALAGSPPMNILPLPVEENRITISGWTMKVPEAPVVLGMRPEDLRLDRPESLALPLRGDVRRIEREGLLARVHVEVDGHVLQVRCESRRIPSDQNVVTLYCELPRLHLFSAGEHGEQLAWDREPPKTVVQLRAEQAEADRLAEDILARLTEVFTPVELRKVELNPEPAPERTDEVSESTVEVGPELAAEASLMAPPAQETAPETPESTVEVAPELAAEASLPEQEPAVESAPEAPAMPEGMVPAPAASSALPMEETATAPTMLEMTPFRAEPPPPPPEPPVDPVAEPFTEPPPTWDAPPSEYHPVSAQPPSGETTSNTDGPDPKTAAA